MLACGFRSGDTVHSSVGFVLLYRRSLRLVKLPEAGVIYSRDQLRLVRVTEARFWSRMVASYASGRGWSSDASLSMRGFLVFLVSGSACLRGFSSLLKKACVTVRNDLGIGLMERVERLCQMKFVLYKDRSLVSRGSAWTLWPSTHTYSFSKQFLVSSHEGEYYERCTISILWTQTFANFLRLVTSPCGRRFMNNITQRNRFRAFNKL